MYLININLCVKFQHQNIATLCSFAILWTLYAAGFTSTGLTFMLRRASIVLKISTPTLAANCDQDQENSFIPSALEGVVAFRHHRRLLCCIFSIVAQNFRFRKLNRLSSIGVSHVPDRVLWIECSICRQRKWCVTAGETHSSKWSIEQIERSKHKSRRRSLKHIILLKARQVFLLHNFPHSAYCDEDEQPSSQSVDPRQKVKKVCSVQVFGKCVLLSLL